MFTSGLLPELRPHSVQIRRKPKLQLQVQLDAAACPGVHWDREHIAGQGGGKERRWIRFLKPLISMYNLYCFQLLNLYEICWRCYCSTAWTLMSGSLRGLTTSSFPWWIWSRTPAPPRISTLCTPWPWPSSSTGPTPTWCPPWAAARRPPASQIPGGQAAGTGGTLTTKFCSTIVKRLSTRISSSQIRIKILLGETIMRRIL